MAEDNQQNPTNPTPPQGGGEGASETPKPVNPEMANVEMNKPESGPAQPAAKTTPPGAPAPKKIKEEKKKPSKTKFLIWIGAIFIALFILFIVLMVLMMSRAGADNAVMQAFGLDAGEIKSFLLLVVSLSFGLLATLFFVLMLIGVFKLISARKGDKDARKSGLKMTFFSLIPFVLIVFLWFVLYNFIGRIEIAAEQVIAEIVVISPEDLTDLQAPVEITFSAVNVARALQNGGINIESMNWDLDGDGEFETPVTKPEVTRLYNQRGTYEVGLQVRVAGEENYRPPYTQIINIEKAVFGADPLKGNAPLTVQFDAGGLVPKGFRVQSLDWDFDADGRYELEGPDNLKPSHTFDKIGVYRVHLRVIDQLNNVENYYREIEVVPSGTPLLSAVIRGVPGLSGPIPLQIRFDASESSSTKGKIINYEWDFGDGSDLQAGKSVSHVFKDPGTYSVRLTVEEDSGQTATDTVTVDARKVSSVPEAVITTTPVFDPAGKELSGELPFKVDFDASDSLDQDNDIVVYEWDFDGDGTVDQEGKKASFTFDQAGTYSVTLTVRDTEDQSGTAAITVVVEEPGVKAVIEANPQEGVAPLVVEFDGSSSSTFEGNIVSYEWDFGDNSPKTITGATVSHKYDAVGNYTVKLKVVTNKNESAESSSIVYVREIPLRACFEPSRRNGAAPLAVTFDPKCSTGAVTKFTWDFGDGEQSGSRKPAHTFQEPGAYTVTLEVGDEKNNVSTTSDVIVAEGEISQ